MKAKQDKAKYPMLSLRIPPGGKEYLRREALEKGMKTPDYVRAILFPFGVSILPVEKISVDKL